MARKDILEVRCSAVKEEDGQGEIYDCANPRYTSCWLEKVSIFPNREILQYISLLTNEERPSDGDSPAKADASVENVSRHSQLLKMLHFF